MRSASSTRSSGSAGLSASERYLLGDLTDDGRVDFEFNSGVVTAPTGEAVATHDALMLLDGQDFTTSVTARHNGGEAVGVVFGYQDANNYFSFELTGGAGDDVRLRQWSDGTATELLSVDAIADSLAGEFYDVEVGYDADLSRLNLTVTDSSSSIYYLGQHTLNEPLALGGLFGMNSTNAGGAQFTTFAAQTTDVERTLGDFNGDGTLTAADTDLIAAAFGPVTQANAIYNLSAPDNVIDQADIDVWQNRILAVVTDPGPGPGLGEPNLTLVVDPATGQVEIRNDSNYTISFDAYTISSATGADSLDGAGWDSLDDQGGAGWRESPEVAGLSDRLSELNPTDALTLSPGEAVSLGVAFEPGSLEDLLFQFRGPADAQIAGDLNGDWVVDAIDYAIWREGLGDEYSAADYDTWLANFGAVNDLPAVVFDGIVTYASLRVSASQTPEPSCLWLAASLGMLQIVRKPQRQPSAC